MVANTRGTRPGHMAHNVLTWPRILWRNLNLPQEILDCQNVMENHWTLKDCGKASSNRPFFRRQCRQSVSFVLTNRASSKTSIRKVSSEKAIIQRLMIKLTFVVASSNHDLTVALGRNASQRSQLEAIDEAQHISPFEVELQPNPVHFPMIEGEASASTSVGPGQDAMHSSVALHTISEAHESSFGDELNMSKEQDTSVSQIFGEHTEGMLDDLREFSQDYANNPPVSPDQQMQDRFENAHPDCSLEDRDHNSKQTSPWLHQLYETDSREGATSPRTSLHSYSTDLCSASTIATSHASSPPDNAESVTSAHVAYTFNPPSLFPCPHCSSNLPSQGRLK